ncbi:ABC transporter ATPase [bacterium SCSIO 12741]|nr:ABC transporter ATPase [bacterium SCSIO 12741]
MLTKTRIDQLPAHSRVWIYQANRTLNEVEKTEISNTLQNFVDSWAAHGAPLLAGFEVVYDRFIVLAVDEDQAAASGCSIDSSVRVFQALDQHYSLDLFNRLSLAYRNEAGEIAVTPMIEFERQLKEGALNADTIVFNNLVTNLGEFQAGWEVPVSKSWHARLMP